MSSQTKFVHLVARIEETKLKGAGKNVFVDYHVQCTRNQCEWSVWHRYSEFAKMRESVERSYPNIQFPVFPGKKLFGNLSDSTTQARVRGINHWISKVLQTQGVKKHRSLLLFLEADQESVPPLVSLLEKGTFTEQLNAVDLLAELTALDENKKKMTPASLKSLLGMLSSCAPVEQRVILRLMRNISTLISDAATWPEETLTVVSSLRHSPDQRASGLADKVFSNLEKTLPAPRAAANGGAPAAKKAAVSSAPVHEAVFAESESEGEGDVEEDTVAERALLGEQEAAVDPAPVAVPAPVVASPTVEIPEVDGERHRGVLVAAAADSADDASSYTHFIWVLNSSSKLLCFDQGDGSLVGRMSCKNSKCKVVGDSVVPHPNTFVLTTAKGKAYYLSAETPAFRDSWVSALTSNGSTLEE